LNWLQVLVACSDVERRTALVGVLTQCGLEPLTAENVSEVRAVLTQRPVHVVFCEDELPYGGFREVLRLMKATGSEVPLVVSSLLGELDQYLEAMQLGAFDFIAPPYSRTEVESIVNSVRQNYLSKQVGGTQLGVQTGGVSREDEAVA
jgi:DNA-binding NtrC family response regulator